jgi:regulator of protease activity HflC (stomatin/prohibitin superfamily)
MNHGKTESGLDRLNRRLAKLMGKRDNKPSPAPKIPSDGKFAGIMLILLVCLWGLTGIYYIPVNSFGIISLNGQLKQIKSGVALGMTLPFPFSDIIVLDADNIEIKVTNATTSHTTPSLMAWSKDNQQLSLAVAAQFRLTNPQYYFSNYYQETSSLNSKMNALLASVIMNYLSKQTLATSLAQNHALLANNIQQLAMPVLANYGFSLTKLSVQSVESVKLTTTQANSKNTPQSLAQQVLAQAQAYAQYKQQQTAAVVADFNQELANYQQNPSLTKQLIYYKMLSQVPKTMPESQNYALLNLTESQFLYRKDVDQQMVSTTNSLVDLRAVNRQVVREREYKGR